MVAQACLVIVVDVCTGAGIWVGVRLGSLDLPAGHIAGATCHLAALGWAISATGLLASAGMGRPAAVAWTTIAVGIVGYFIKVTVSMAPEHERWAIVSPFHWYPTPNPLLEGANWANVAILVGAAIITWTLAFPLFARRDLAR